MAAAADVSWAEHAGRTLSGAGYRAGGARQEVLDLLARQRCCLSAQAIHDRLRDSGRPVGLASVYRALDVLTGLHLVHRVELDGIASYEPAHPGGDHHHHAVCDSCGRVAAFEDPEIEARIAQVAARLGFSPGAHDVVLRGICKDC